MTPSTHTQIRMMELLFQRVPYGVTVVWVPDGEQVYKLLHSISKKKGHWLWKGEKKPASQQAHSDPTFQLGTFRLWSIERGKWMVGTKDPDMDKLKGWVESL